MATSFYGNILEEELKNKVAADWFAALYDIRLHFQGVNEKGKMNTGSQDEHYNLLMGELRQSLKVLAQKIEPKVYEYGFLKR